MRQRSLLFWSELMAVAASALVVASIQSAPGRDRSAAPDSAQRNRKWIDYVNREYGLQLRYPSDWIRASTSNDPNDADVMWRVQDPAVRGSTELGGRVPPTLTLRVRPLSTYKPFDSVARFGVPRDEITEISRGLVVRGSPERVYRYTSSATEGASRITERLELRRGDRMYVLEYEYIEAGCNNIPTAFRPDCESANRKLATEAASTFTGILESLAID